MKRVAEPEEEPDPLSLGQPGSIRIHSVTSAFLRLSETPFALS